MDGNASAIPTSELNVTPMLDVLLVLLITFMAMALPVHHTIDAQLPQECAGACAGGSEIVLEVLPGPTYRVNRSPVPANDLATRLSAIYRDRPEKIIYVAGDRHVSYQEVITAMDVARSAGVRVLSVAP
jgi:biopolymer transport protein ExbD